MSTDASSSSTQKRSSNSGISESVLNQLQVLKALSADAKETKRYIEINEITQLAGFSDEKETQRFLFILEGHKLVAPFPEGDLTSRKWCITPTGQSAIQQFGNN
jgi:hypothetical protein